jgi:hypothetical protein
MRPHHALQRVKAAHFEQAQAEAPGATVAVKHAWQQLLLQEGEQQQAEYEEKQQQKGKRQR